MSARRLAAATCTSRAAGAAPWVFFEPSTREQQHAALFVAAGGSQAFVIALSGRGRLQATLVFDVEGVDFGDVLVGTTSEPAVVILSNAGDLAAEDVNTHSPGAQRVGDPTT